MQDFFHSEYVQGNVVYRTNLVPFRDSQNLAKWIHSESMQVFERLFSGGHWNPPFWKCGFLLGWWFSPLRRMQNGETREPTKKWGPERTSRAFTAIWSHVKASESGTSTWSFIHWFPVRYRFLVIIRLPIESRTKKNMWGNELIDLDMIFLKSPCSLTWSNANYDCPCKTHILRRQTNKNHQSHNPITPEISKFWLRFVQIQTLPMNYVPMGPDPWFWIHKFEPSDGDEEFTAWSPFWKFLTQVSMDCMILFPWGWMLKKWKKNHFCLTKHV